MIDSINSGISMMMSAPQRSNESLTEDQQTLLSETLAEYDADNLSESDALAIVNTLSEAGIQPGEALETAMTSAGFDAKSIGDLANVQEEGSRPPPPPPPSQSSEEITAMADYLAELLEEKLAESGDNGLSDEDKQSVLAQVFEKFDLEDGESIINTSA